MRNLGWLLSLGGVALGVFALLMDVSVPVGDGSRVNNIGLMAERQNYLIVAAVLFIGGILLANKTKKNMPRNNYKAYDLSTINKDDFIKGDGSVNLEEVRNFSIFLLEKHSGKSVSEITFMNIPLIERIAGEMPAPLGKSFKSELERSLKANI
ncbi:TPA: hypothetical protein QCH56_004141 [Enterobacter roggenkampii]|uniref:hypothetical protein n=1 Tax=Enterobacter chuandaensis TaxID=2497875 RepID=UPI0032177537|nr:hypothetical protein [Enterobacter roggenkampii]